MGGRFSAPTALADALTAAADGHRPVAGGTDLVVGTRQGKWSLPEDLVALDRIAELRGIDRTPDGLRIGATTSHADLAAHPEIRERWTAIADAASIVGSPATRHLGTLGGNLANASPAAETSGPLLCFDAQVELRSTAGERRVALADLFTGPGRTSIAPNELIVAVELAEIAGVGSCYVRLEFRRQMEIAVVGATAVVRLEGDVVREARIAITALAPTVRRVAAAESALVGTDGGAAAATEAGRLAAEAAAPISDVRASLDYRRAMAAVVVRRAVTGAIARARGETVPVPASASLFGVGVTVRHAATLKVNGTSFALEIDAGRTLLSVLRGELGLTGSKEGCDDSECGACMVLLDGRPVNSCSFLALQADGREVTTVEGLASGSELHPLQRAFLEHGGVQCGFCTPGMLISASALLKSNPDPTEEEIRAGLSGNLCRCTGYVGIVAAVQSAATELAKAD